MAVGVMEEKFLGVHFATVELACAAARHQECEPCAQFVLRKEKRVAQVQKNTSPQMVVFGYLQQVPEAIVVFHYVCMYMFRARCRFLDFLPRISDILYKER